MNVEELLARFSEEKKSHVLAQTSDLRKAFERKMGSGLHDATITQEEIERINGLWPDAYLSLIPGKDAFAFVNSEMRRLEGINVSAYGVIDCTSAVDIPSDLTSLFDALIEFTA